MIFLIYNILLLDGIENLSYMVLDTDGNVYKDITHIDVNGADKNQLYYQLVPMKSADSTRIVE